MENAENANFEVIDTEKKGKFKKFFRFKYLFYFAILALLAYLLYKWIINPYIISPINQVAGITKTQTAMQNTDTLILDSLGSIQSDMASIVDALNTLSANDSIFDSKIALMDVKIDKNHKANVDGFVGLLTNVVAP